MHHDFVFPDLFSGYIFLSPSKSVPGHEKEQDKQGEQRQCQARAQENSHAVHQLEGPVSECTIIFSLILLLAFPLSVPGHEEEQDEQGQHGKGQAARAQAESHAVHQLGSPQEQPRPCQALADS